ncbi:hypothetical protein H6764_00030 [Candidatus Nomurabacteria bacterium]|nr:hypothetical protein [Candidatus Nomurabacteria bacterium]
MFEQDDTSDKKEKINKLLLDLKGESCAENLSAIRQGQVTNVGLINQFKKHNFIPNLWFDWARRLDADVMIIGQDWGPYIELKKVIDQYEIEKSLSGFDYDDFLLRTANSRTEKLIFRILQKTYLEKYSRQMPAQLLSEFIFTIAVMFTRQGKHFRGSEYFDPTQSIENSYQYLSRQIEIVQPLVVIPLGGLALKIVNEYFNLGFGEKTVTQIIQDTEPTGYIESDSTSIIPCFHPAAHISPDKQAKQWKVLWDVLDKQGKEV